MNWFSRKERRPRGPYTPQARALNWKTFIDDAEPVLRDLDVSPSAWQSQDAFEEFLKTGRTATGESWSVRSSGDERRLRELVWSYRDRTKRHFGPSFLERDQDQVSAVAAEDVLRELRKSTLWGTNGQPSDERAFADTLATLPLFAVEMKRADALVLRFLRPLTETESEQLLRAGGLGNSANDPFVAGEPKLSAFCWWG